MGTNFYFKRISMIWILELSMTTTSQHVHKAKLKLIAWLIEGHRLKSSVLTYFVYKVATFVFPVFENLKCYI